MCCIRSKLRVEIKKQYKSHFIITIKYKCKILVNKTKHTTNSLNFSEITKIYKSNIKQT